MKRPKLKSQSQLLEQCREWNLRVPVGADVRYHPVIGEPKYRLRKTRGEAFVLSGHTACVFLEGERGCVALDACVPIREGGGVMAHWDQGEQPYCNKHGFVYHSCCQGLFGFECA